EIGATELRELGFERLHLRATNERRGAERVAHALHELFFELAMRRDQIQERYGLHSHECSLVRAGSVLRRARKNGARTARPTVKKKSPPSWCRAPVMKPGST